MSTLLTISEVSRRSGVAASALRFYEEKSLIKSARAGRVTAAPQYSRYTF
jgi:MerR family redox-sensitive transcriptional activator SoxR